MKYVVNYPHGIMFHHFHNNFKHRKTQGSINIDQFHKIIKYIGKKNILDPIDFYHFKNKDRLKKNHLCLTFDDSLLCQYDIVLPYLEEENIKTFFFVYTSVYDDNPELLEIYRYFRVNYFKNLDEFYNNFFKLLKVNQFNKIKKYKKTIGYFRKNFKFYSQNDIFFRIYRDFILNENEYKRIMKNLFDIYKFKPEKIYKKIFMSKKNLKKISSLGHQIGLHSHTHPTMMNKVNKSKQKRDYKTNLIYLKKIIGQNKKIFSMSHPCGRYNSETFKILNDLEVNLGFISTMKNNFNNKNYNYLIPRQDHANLVSKLKI